MGAFFVNHHVRTDSAEPVIAAMRELATAGAYVSPPKNGWVSVYDKISEDQDSEHIERIAARLSQALRAPVIAFLDHDSDYLVYWIYIEGREVDYYNSVPNYWGEMSEEDLEEAAGQPEVLASICTPGTTPEAVEALLHSPDLFAEDVLIALAPLLGIDGDRSVLGFNYLVNEGATLLPDIEQFQPVGSASPLRQ